MHGGPSGRGGASRRRRPRSGFTLLELLISTAIIALIAGILLPVIMKAKGAARQAVCVANLRQIGLAWVMYCDDWERRPEDLPQLVEAGYLRDKRLMVCPADPYDGVWSEDLMREDPPAAWPWTDMPCSYPYFGGMRDDRWETLLRVGGSVGIVVCVAHGERTRDRPWPTILSYEGLLLRLCADGAVVRRHNVWPSCPDRVQADPWVMMTDSPVEEAPPPWRWSGCG